MTIFDVCISGAGPAGTSAALELARGGARVVLLDRHREPGGKACGGGLSRESWRAAGLSPERLPACGRSHDSLRVASPLGSTTLRIGEPLLVTIDRTSWMAERIAELRDLGVEVRLAERVLGLRRGRALTETGELRCSAIVGADGASSRIRRLAGLARGPATRSMQLTVSEDSAPGRRLARLGPAVWFDPRLLGVGYGWSFPVCGEVRVGCGVPGRSLGSPGPRKAFLAWLEKIGVDPSAGRIGAGSIPHGYSGHRLGDVFLCGDAAGLASPVTGEGIGPALISGAEVAREIMEPGFRSREIPRLGRRHRRTFGLLSDLRLGAPLYGLAPWILRLPGVGREAIRRYAS
ncbi:MAG: NAD(P)/FAD-dependent oxidoreductase [Polyangia bacterium]